MSTDTFASLIAVLLISSAVEVPVALARVRALCHTLWEGASLIALALAVVVVVVVHGAAVVGGATPNIMGEVGARAVGEVVSTCRTIPAETDGCAVLRHVVRAV